MSQQETFEKEKEEFFEGERALKELYVACKEIADFRVSRRGDVIYLHVQSREELSGFLENDRMRLDFYRSGKRIAFRINVKRAVTIDDATFVGFFVDALGHLILATNDGDKAIDLKWGETWFRTKRLDVAIIGDALSIIARHNWNTELYKCHGEIKTGSLQISFEPVAKNMRFTVRGKLTVRRMRNIRELIRAFELI
jgi:hypothetical protein